MYDTEIDLTDENNVHTQQIRLVGSNRSVLEVGPARGYVTRELSKMGCRVTCIEINPEIASIAERFCEQMIVGDVEKIDLDETLQGKQFDVVLLGDILEHLREPQKVLKTLTKFLNPSGYVVATIPNVAHGSIRLLLLMGRFDYGPSGLLDSTHLRFFTRETMKELFRNAGLHIVEVKDIKCEIFSAPDIMLNPKDFPEELIDSIRQDPDATTYQFAVKAKPLSTEPPLVEARRFVDPIAGLREIIRRKDDYIGNLEASVREMEDSLGWRVVRQYRRFNDRYFRAGTRRRVIVDRLAVVLEIILDEGFRSFFHRVVDRYVRRRKQFFELTRDEQYQIWLSNNELTEDKLLEFQTEISQFSYKPKISIVMPVYNPGERWLRAAIDSVRNQVYSNWELCIVDDASTKRGVKKILESYGAKDRRIKVRYLKENRGISGASNEALTTASGDFVGFLDHDDELTRDALFEVVKVLNQDPDLDLIYSDEDKKDLNGRRVEPFFKSDWSPDLLLSMNYICHFTVARKSLIDKVGGFRLGFEGSQDYDLVLRVTELTDRIGHVHKPLYSWRKVPGSAAATVEAKPYARERAKMSLREALNRRGLKGEVLDGFGGHHRVKYAIQGAPLVSIVIPTKDRVDLLKRCLKSLESKTSYRNYEIIIVDNNSTDESTLAYLESLPHRVLKFEEPFNFSRINNFGAKYAKGEHVLFLNNDTEVADEHWLDSMLEHSQRPEVGMVGALLLYPSGIASHAPGTIQHGGVILGVGGVAGHAFKYLPADRHYYFDLHWTIRNCSAVTGACAMIRREVLDEVGGFDENLKVAFGDIDLCLRVREKGYRVVYTPYAMLYHKECATRGKLHPSEDEAYMMNRWRDTLIKGDTYYSANLTLLREDYSLASKGSSIRPLAVLLDIYHLRPDLQRAYPEVRDEDYRRLVDWAATSGITVDSLRVVLRPYNTYYASNASEHMKPLAVLAEIYSSRVDLQRRYPEVLNGEFRRLVKWANDVLAKIHEEEAFDALKPYEASYGSLVESA